jgi:hypothetical protein
MDTFSDIPHNSGKIARQMCRNAENIGKYDQNIKKSGSRWQNACRVLRTRAAE